MTHKTPPSKKGPHTKISKQYLFELNTKAKHNLYSINSPHPNSKGAMKSTGVQRYEGAGCTSKEDCTACTEVKKQVGDWTVAN